LTGKTQPFWLYYTDITASKRIGIKCVYQGGFDLSATGAFTEETEIRLVASDPFWYAEGNGSTPLTTSLTVANADYIIRNVDGVWSAMAGLNGDVYAIAIAPSGAIYAGGNFTNASGVADADYIARWDVGATVWREVGTSLALNGIVVDIKIAPSGVVYIGGNFTNAAGIANADYIVSWNGSAFAALGTGMNGAVNRIEVMQNGSLMVGGAFTSAGGVADTDYLAIWDGANWQSVDPAKDGAVTSFAAALDGSIYIGGTFTGFVNKYKDGVLTTLGTSPDDYVYCLAVASDQSVIIGGDFDNAGGGAKAKIGRWNNSAWNALGSGLNNIPRALKYINGILHVGGAFAEAGGIQVADAIALWNGYSWAQTSATLPGSPTVYAIASRGSDYYYGFTTTGSATTSYQNTVTVANDREVNPIYKLVCSAGPGVLYSIKNDTTGRQMWFNYTIQTGETLTVNFDPLNFGAVSSFYGDVTGRALLRGSDFTQFKLLPGVNKISAFISGGTVAASLEWPLRFWAIDGITSL